MLGLPTGRGRRVMIVFYCGLEPLTNVTNRATRPPAREPPLDTANCYKTNLRESVGSPGSLPIVDDTDTLPTRPAVSGGGGCQVGGALTPGGKRTIHAWLSERWKRARRLCHQFSTDDG